MLGSRLSDDRNFDRRDRPPTRAGRPVVEAPLCLYLLLGFVLPGVGALLRRLAISTQECHR